MIVSLIVRISLLSLFLCDIARIGSANTHCNHLFTFHRLRRIDFGSYYHLSHDRDNNDDAGEEEYTYKQPSVNISMVRIGFPTTF